jgi:hypothetical protein
MNFAYLVVIIFDVLGTRKTTRKYFLFYSPINGLENKEERLRAGQPKKYDIKHTQLTNILQASFRIVPNPSSGKHWM